MDFATLLLVLLVGCPPTSASAQIAGGGEAASADGYADPTAEALHGAALRSWQRIDEGVVRYTALVKNRLAAQLRTPLKDRTLYRSEGASRVFWDRDGETIIQVLASREQTPVGVEPPGLGNVMDGFFDPAGDRLFFGLSRSEELGSEGRDEFWFHHPLAPDATDHYRFRTGDTLTLRLADGRSLRAIELEAIPRRADVHRISGSLWIEPESGALVRAAYRLADRFDAVRDVPELREEDDEGAFDMVPGIFKPWTFDLSLVVVDYALWDFEVWLPRSLRVEGVVGAGILEAPATFDVSYRVESVVTEDDLEREGAGEAPTGVAEVRHFESREEAMRFMAELLAEDEGVAFEPRGGWTAAGSATTRRNDRTIRYLVPEDLETLHESPHLPPPVWEDAPGFVSEEDVEQMTDVLADLPQPSRAGALWTASWGLERPDLVRYNRVEGPAIGARVGVETASPFGPLAIELEPFFGFADLEPKARLTIGRESVKRRIRLSGYRELRSAVRGGNHLGLGNSLGALLWGRDEGEYFLASGADLVVGPPTSERASWSVRLYGERHRAVDRETDVALAKAFDDGGCCFRPNITASEHDEVGGEVTVSPWWGTDPLAAQGGLEVYAQGAAGDIEYGRASLLLRASLPFDVGGRRHWKVSLEAGGGESWGDVPVQRNFFLGGSRTLRGYDASTLAGPSFARVRGEIARAFPVAALSAFVDGGWVGEGLDDFRESEALWSVGVGVSALDGLLRLDVARGLREPEQTRVDLYLDAAF